MKVFTLMIILLLLTTCGPISAKYYYGKNKINEEHYIEIDSLNNFVLKYPVPMRSDETPLFTTGTLEKDGFHFLMNSSDTSYFDFKNTKCKIRGKKLIIFTNNAKFVFYKC